MKLLFDENLSPKLPRLVGALFAGSRHVREFGLKGQTDEEIWNYAKANGFAIISKDKDFYQLRSAAEIHLVAHRQLHARRFDCDDSAA